MREALNLQKVEALRAIRLKTEPPYAERHVRWGERGEKISPARFHINPIMGKHYIFKNVAKHLTQ